MKPNQLERDRCSAPPALGLVLALALALVPQATAEMEGDGMEERCRREVVELHRFFERWFGAEGARGDVDFERFSGVMGEGFVLISPDGTLTERGPLIDGLRRARGRWADGGGRIWIDGFRFHRMAGDHAVVTYREWQEHGGETRGRLSTAVFGPQEGAPHGVAWLHLHEVWLPAGD